MSSFCILDIDVANTSNATPTVDDGQVSGNNITCLDDFMEVNSTCLPVCEKFQQFSSPGLANVVVYSEVVAGAVALIVAILIIACATGNYKKM